MTGVDAILSKSRTERRQPGVGAGFIPARVSTTPYGASMMAL
jgi:hypothetical protein